MSTLDLIALRILALEVANIGQGEKCILVILVVWVLVQIWLL
jgi:cell division protein FtsL